MLANNEVVKIAKFKKPSAKLMRKWNRIQLAWQAELERIEDAFWPEPDYPPLQRWGDESSLWDDIEMFGIILDDTGLESLSGFYVDQDTGRSHDQYWIPDGWESEIPTIDTPSLDGVAWDAAPVYKTGTAIIS